MCIYNHLMCIDMYVQSLDDILMCMYSHLMCIDVFMLTSDVY